MIESSCDETDRLDGPLAIRATNARFVADFSDGPEKLFSCDFSTSRCATVNRTFEGILVIEEPTAALIYGIEDADGYPTGLAPLYASKQQAFIEYLRGENFNNEKIFGPVVRAFSSFGYSSELLATRAYIAARKVVLDAVVGTYDQQNRYHLLVLPGDHD